MRLLIGDNASTPILRPRQRSGRCKRRSESPGGHQRFTSCHLQCIEALGGGAHSGVVRNAITAALVLGFMATNASVALRASDNTPQIAQQTEMGRVATPKLEREGGARVQVRVSDHGMMPAADQTVALRAAAGVLAAAGIDVTWLLCGEDASASSPRMCESPLGTTELSLRLVRLPGVPSARGQLQLGYSLCRYQGRRGEARDGVRRPRALARGAGRRRYGGVSGFAIAHEIGHLLLGTNAHSASGLMRAVWSRAELERTERADWLFSPEQAVQMRSSLAQRDGLRSSHGDANGCPASLGDADGVSAECSGDALASLRGVAARPDR